MSSQIIQLQHRQFILRYIVACLNLMDAGLFIHYPREPDQNIYFKVLDGQNIYFKKLPAPHPLRINCPSPNKKGTSFNHSPIVPTAIAMPYGL